MSSSDPRRPDPPAGTKLETPTGGGAIGNFRGSVEGLATITDILETIAGDLPEPGENKERDAVERDDGSWLVNGSMPVDEFEDVVGIRGLRDIGDYHTIAGFVLHGVGH